MVDADCPRCGFHIRESMGEWQKTFCPSCGVRVHAWAQKAYKRNLAELAPETLAEELRLLAKNVNEDVARMLGEAARRLDPRTTRRVPTGLPGDALPKACCCKNPDRPGIHGKHRCSYERVKEHR